MHRCHLEPLRLPLRIIHFLADLCMSSLARIRCNTSACTVHLRESEEKVGKVPIERIGHLMIHVDCLRDRKICKRVNGYGGAKDELITHDSEMARDRDEDGRGWKA